MEGGKKASGGRAEPRVTAPYKNATLSSMVRQDASIYPNAINGGVILKDRNTPG